MSNVCPSLNIEKHQIHKVFRTTAVAYQLSKLQLGTWWTLRYLIVFSGVPIAGFLASDFKQQIPFSPPDSWIPNIKPFLKGFFRSSALWGFSLALNHWSWRILEGEYFCTKKNIHQLQLQSGSSCCGSGGLTFRLRCAKTFFLFRWKNSPVQGKTFFFKVMLLKSYLREGDGTGSSVAPRIEKARKKEKKTYSHPHNFTKLAIQKDLWNFCPKANAVLSVPLIEKTNIYSTKTYKNLSLLTLFLCCPYICFFLYHSSPARVFTLKKLISKLTAHWVMLRPN